MKRRPEEPVGELNLVPYMDIVVNLILFLMLSATGFVQLGVVDVKAPVYGPGDDRPALRLTVAIDARGFRVEGEAPGLPATIPGRDYPALTRKVAEIKRAFARETTVQLRADPDTTYEVLLAAMDATRKDGATLLFPDVTIMR